MNSEMFIDLVLPYISDTGSIMYCRLLSKKIYYSVNTNKNIWNNFSLKNLGCSIDKIINKTKRFNNDIASLNQELIKNKMYMIYDSILTNNTNLRFDIYYCYGKELNNDYIRIIKQTNKQKNNFMLIQFNKLCKTIKHFKLTLCN